MTMARRKFLAAAAATAMTRSASAQQTERGTIDVHHHGAPDFYIEDLKRRPGGGGAQAYAGWTPQRSLDDMARAGVATAVLSFNNPWAGDDARAARLSRGLNEYAAKLAQQYKGRFGRFAALPLPNVELALEEIAYALDELKADGVGMMTNYGDKWLGDPHFLPVMEELNRRKAVVFTHPTTANCCGNLLPGISDSIIEYQTDTTRTIASLAFLGTMKRCPDIRFIFSHSGGTMPFVMGRFHEQERTKHTAATTPEAGVFPTLRAHYYDCAQTANPIAVGGLAKLVPISQILFGSDYPFNNAAAHVTGLATCGFSARELRAIKRDNAKKLLPRVGV